MTPITKRYRVNGDDEYTLQFKLDSAKGTYSIYCTDRPFCPFDTSPQKTHLYSSGLICVTTGREPKTLERAVAIGMVWMQNFSHYCRTGNFPNTGGKARV